MYNTRHQNYTFRALLLMTLSRSTDTRFPVETTCAAIIQLYYYYYTVALHCFFFFFYKTDVRILRRSVASAGSFSLDKRRYNNNIVTSLSFPQQIKFKTIM